MRPIRALVVILGLVLLQSSCAVDAVEPASGTECRVGDVELLTAQTVAGASYVPCLAHGLEEWQVESNFYGSRGTRVSLATERLDGRWKIEFGSSCDPGDLPAEKPIESFRGEFFRRVDDGGPRYRETAYYRFDGGCVVSDVDLPRNRVLDVVLEERADALDLVARAELEDEVERRTDGRLSLDP
jgi:hypothetical protein